MINLCSRGPHQGDVKMVSWLETQDVEARAESVRTWPFRRDLVLGSGGMLGDYFSVPSTNISIQNHEWCILAHDFSTFTYFYGYLEGFKYVCKPLQCSLSPSENDPQMRRKIHSWYQVIYTFTRVLTSKIWGCSLITLTNDGWFIQRKINQLLEHENTE